MPGHSAHNQNWLPRAKSMATRQMMKMTRHFGDERCQLERHVIDMDVPRSTRRNCVL